MGDNIMKTLFRAAALAALIFMAAITAGIVSAKGAEAHPKEAPHCHVTHCR